MRTTLNSKLICLGLALLFIFGQYSCAIVKKDNGNHKGWTKNTNNPHNPNTTNPGHTKSGGASKGKSGK